MRAADSDIGPGEARVVITFEGREVVAREGETLAAALTAIGINDYRITQFGERRGLFCGMGVCQECLLDVDGQPNRRACMTKVSPSMIVRRQVHAPEVRARAAPKQRSVHEQKPVSDEPDILVVGGGAGGLTAAAVAAEAGARVVLVDERPVPGGQFFKQPISTLVGTGMSFEDRQALEGRKLIARARDAGVEFLDAMVWAASSPREVHIQGASGNRMLRPKQLIVATGAYERGVPVPGWTLPGVMTTGAAQTLLRSYRVLAGRRVLVAGNGPLNLQVAAELVEAGAQVVGVAELAPRPGPATVGAAWRMLMSAPDLVAQGRRYLRTLKTAGVGLHYRYVLTRIAQAENGLSASLAALADGTVRTFEADAVLMGYGFMPSNELLRLLGCAHDYDAGRRHLVTRRDDVCRTTIAGVFAVGDCCGLGGARAAQAEGVIAGLAAAGETGCTIPAGLVKEGLVARTDLVRQHRFQSALWQLFAADLPGLADDADDTVVCRCEDLTQGDLAASLQSGFQSLGELKRCTRLGMGRCQGRYCAPALAEYLHHTYGRALDEFAFFAPRPPIKPIGIGDAVLKDERAI